MPAAVEHEVSTVSAHDPANGVNPGLRRFLGFEADRGFGAERAAQGQPGLFRGADDDHPPGAHLLGGDDRQHTDGTRPLDDDRVANPKASRPGSSIQRSNTRGKRLGEGAEHKAHVIGQAVDLRGREHVEIDVHHLRPAAPQVRRFFKSQVAAVVGRIEALVGVCRVVHAVVALAARHQRRQHHLAAHTQRPPHEIRVQGRTFFHDHTASLWPRVNGQGRGFGQCPWRMWRSVPHTPQTPMRMRAASSGTFGPRHLSHLDPGAGPVKSRYTDCAHASLAQVSMPQIGDEPTGATSYLARMTPFVMYGRDMSRPWSFYIFIAKCS